MVNNDSNTIYVTTEDFKIRNKNNDNYLTIEETRKIFPPCQKTNSFIDFARLRPKISSTIPGEHIKLTAEFSVGTAKDNSMYNVVSKCSYGNTLDPLKISEFWEQYEQKLLTEKMTKEEIEFQKKNFYLLDAQRHFIPDSFDFVIQTIGIYDNIEIVKKSCIIIQNKLIELIKAVDSDTIPINYSETTMDYCFDIILENEDYTIGKVLEYLLYEKYYVTDKVFSFCGFKKFHPHNTDSVIRVAYVSANDKNMVKQHLRLVCIDASEIFKRIYELF